MSFDFSRNVISAMAKMAPLLLNMQVAQRLSILAYHRVLATPDSMRPGEPTVAEFDWQMRLLREHFSPLPLVEAVERMQSGTLPDRAVCVTFDDGYADNEQLALPVLLKYHIPATVFVSTGFLNGGRMWNDSVIESLRVFQGDELDLRDYNLGHHNLESFARRREAAESILQKIKHLDPAVRIDLVNEIERRVRDLPNDLMLTDAQLETLTHNDIAIGAHTVNHPILASVSDAIARSEILAGKVYLEDLLKKEVEVFAYPNGKPGQDYSPEHRDIVKDIGFRAAVSTHWGVSSTSSDMLQLPRFTPWDRGQFKFALRLMANYRLGDDLASNAT